MFRYLIFGYQIESEIELGIPKCKRAKKAQIKIRRQNVKFPADSVVHKIKLANGKFTKIARTGRNKIHIKFANGLLAEISQQNIFIFESIPLAKSSVEVLILNQILPYFISAKGHLLLHAGSLCKGSNALLLSGLSGSGKSTLILNFLRRNWSYLGDESAFIIREPKGFYKIVPSFPELRLKSKPSAEAVHRRDEAAKHRVQINKNFCTRPPNLKLIILLSPNRKKDYKVVTLEGLDKFSKVIQNAYWFRLKDQLWQKRVFNRWMSLLEEVPVVEIKGPRGQQTLKRWMKIIEEQAWIHQN